VYLKFADIFRKGLIETLRDRRHLIFLLGFPVVLIVLFAFAFGSGSFLSGGSLPHQIVVVNNDAGVKLVANNTTQYTNYGANFRGVLQNATAQDGGEHIFSLNNANQAKAEDLLKSRSIDALVIIPKNFSAGIATMVNNSTRAAITSSLGQQVLSGAANANPGAGGAAALPQAGNASSQLIVEGDSGYVNFLNTQGFVTVIFDQYKNDVKTQAMAAAASGQPQTLYNDSTPLYIQPIAGTQSFSLFDYMVPGLIVFALLLQISVVTGSLLRDVEKGTLDRLKLSKVSSFDLLFGTFSLWTVITAAQVLVLLAIAMLLGYSSQGGVGSLALAILIGVIAGMASISVALIIASFTTNERQAASVSAMFSMPLGFLAGAFIPLPRQVIVEYGGHTYQLYDLLPWTWAIAALRSVLTYGSGLSADVALDMIWLVALTAMLFVLGVAIYATTRLRAEK
jgi:ABC-2 type transport system permease protein